MLTPKNRIHVKMIASAIRRQAYQEKCLVGLGLKKIGQVSQLDDTPSIRGMINKVSHLVEVLNK